MLGPAVAPSRVTSANVSATAQELGRRAAGKGAEGIRRALSRNARARVVLATGASQFATLGHLVREPGIDRSRVTVFHLDKYISLSPDDPASFRRHLREPFVSRVGTVELVPLEGDAPAQSEIARLGTLLARAPGDVCSAGLGENCHVAFNDPPADSTTDGPFLVIKLDKACRRQLLGEGWFATLEDVPKTALPMSIRQIMRSDMMTLSVPEQRRAASVRDMRHQPIDPRYPGTILRQHLNTQLFLDAESASLSDLPP